MSSQQKRIQAGSLLNRHPIQLDVSGILIVNLANIQSLPLLLKELRLTAIGRTWQALSKKAIKASWEPAQYLADL